MNKPIAISVVVPAYNEEQLIARCLTSLTNQRFDHLFEIIVVDNNSTDKTVSIVKNISSTLTGSKRVTRARASQTEFHKVAPPELAGTMNEVWDTRAPACRQAGQDPYIKIIYEHHQGVVWARQKGLSVATGEIIAGADCDCTYPADWLQKIYDNFQKDPQVVAVGGPGVIIGKNPWWAFYINQYGFSLINFIYKITGFVFYLIAFNFAFKRQLFISLGGYHTYLDLGGGDEYEPLSRLRKVGKVIFDEKLKVYTSGRRYRVGFFRWFFVQNFYYYILNFWLASIFKKTIIKSKPVRNI